MTSSTPIARTDLGTEKPGDDEIEISVFGPGVGECIVAHLGNGDWIIVDSCIDRASGKPVALAYLEAIGVAPVQVKLIVITHWHDDHMKGVSQVFAACSEAIVSFSAALRTSEFKKLLGACQTAYMEDSGLKELHGVLAQLQTRKSGRAQAKGPSWAIASKLLFQREPSSVSVTSLSPSDGSLTLALNEFAGLLPKENEPKRNVVAQKQNSTCVVLWIQIGEFRALLGADLQTTPNAATGWSAIVSSDTRPPGKAQFYKVAHHGSENADLEAIWTTLLAEKPVAVVTPYNSGRKPLPSDEDKLRLLERTPHVYQTTSRSKKLNHDDSAARRMLRVVAPDIRPRRREMGQVRFRSRPDGRSAIALFGGATRLDSMG